MSDGRWIYKNGRMVFEPAPNRPATIPAFPPTPPSGGPWEYHPGYNEPLPPARFNNWAGYHSRGGPGHFNHGWGSDRGRGRGGSRLNYHNGPCHDMTPPYSRSDGRHGRGDNGRAPVQHHQQQKPLGQREREADGNGTLHQGNMPLIAMPNEGS